MDKEELLQFLSGELKKMMHAKTEKPNDGEYENICVLPEELDKEHVILEEMADALGKKRAALDREEEYYSARCKIFWYGCQQLTDGKTLRINGNILQAAKEPHETKSA